MTKASTLPDQDVLRQLLDYDPDTGRLFWRARPGEDRAARIFNTQFAGKEAFTATDSRGYHLGGIYRKTYPAHRVIWKWMTGSDPEIIDHINGETGDNRWTNLRNVTQQENTRNMRLSVRNNSGTPGVYFVPKRGTWEARLSKKILGCSYPTKEAAIAARLAAQAAAGYHPNHGRAA